MYDPINDNDDFQLDDDRYADYVNAFDPDQAGSSKTGRARKLKAKQDKRGEAARLAAIAQTQGLEAGLKTTYQPSLFEEGWLVDSLRTFYDQALISDVLTRVRGGKEANVYACEADPNGAAADMGLVAAKVYRPRMFRNLSNDGIYREGRQVLTEGGRAAKATDQRLMRALHKKSDFGVQAAHTSWLMHEFNTLKALHEAGADVPKPLAAGDNAILMQYIGDANGAAPTLNTVELEPDECAPLFDQVIRSVVVMLQLGLIHGDLSAYNVLYWEGSVTLIDFPQVVQPDVNSRGREILARDIRRICEYFASQGLQRDADAITFRLWKRYAAKDDAAIAADFSRIAEREAREEEERLANRTSQR